MATFIFVVVVLIVTAISSGSGQLANVCMRPVEPDSRGPSQTYFYFKLLECSLFLAPSCNYLSSPASVGSAGLIAVYRDEKNNSPLPTYTDAAGRHRVLHVGGYADDKLATSLRGPFTVTTELCGDCQGQVADTAAMNKFWTAPRPNVSWFLFSEC